MSRFQVRGRAEVERTGMASTVSLLKQVRSAAISRSFKIGRDRTWKRLIHFVTGSKTMYSPDSSERGFSLVEILVSISLFSIVGMSLAYALITMTHVRGRTYHNSLASQIAIEGIEDYQSLDPATLTSTSRAQRSGALWSA